MSEKKNRRAISPVILKWKEYVKEVPGDVPLPSKFDRLLILKSSYSQRVEHNVDVPECTHSK